MSLSKTEEKNLKRLCDIAINSNLSYCDPELKAEFHRKGKVVLKYVARELGLVADTYEIRSNMGGIAVSGEITLHGEEIYIQLSKITNDCFMFRYCNGRKDYVGRNNWFMEWSKLRNEFDECIARFKKTVTLKV